MSKPEPSLPDPGVREDGKRTGQRFVIEYRRRGLRRGWWVVSVGGNSKTLQHSEVLNSHAAALTNIEAMRKLADAPVEDRT